MKIKKNTFTLLLSTLFFTSFSFATTVVDTVVAQDKMFFCEGKANSKNNFTLLLSQDIAPIAVKAMSDRTDSDLYSIDISDTRTQISEEIFFVSTDDLKCNLAGEGGILLGSSGGGGPNNWTYRLPADAYSQQSFTIPYVFDVDSDGMACQPDLYQCVEIANLN